MAEAHAAPPGYEVTRKSATKLPGKATGISLIQVRVFWIRLLFRLINVWAKSSRDFPRALRPSTSAVPARVLTRPMFS
ncbi:MAG: hypothetical protein JRF59_01955 [Deltaproteobacteria bacterium]|nr:hypothetical protein [Deltaproteobacteria bacterium]MBW1948392.1 hypothetical protein [Deltaproteobacteria bacterium]MBW2007099.1 hypothetical protein [Deltaproteobacteria bacterium]MBW2346592.1 hypothetical protein [Deltaproteobacteria bacterium]